MRSPIPYFLAVLTLARVAGAETPAEAKARNAGNQSEDQARALVNGASRAPIPPETVARLVETDPEFAAAVAAVLSDSRDGGHFERRRRLIQAMADGRIARFRPALERLYMRGAEAGTLRQLERRMEISRILHPAMVEWGVSDQPDFRRSPAYKRLLRRQRQLLDSK